MYLDARNNQLKSEASEYIFSKLQNLGYELVYEAPDDISDEAKISVIVKKQKYAEITQSTLDLFYKNLHNPDILETIDLEDIAETKNTCILAKRLKI